MVTYYIYIPNSRMPTAEVEATSTRHARTAYLDYLSRNNLIGWGDRQAVRGHIKVNRMQPGEMQTQVKLEYGVGEPPVQEVEAPPTTEPVYVEAKPPPKGYATVVSIGQQQSRQLGDLRRPVPQVQSGEPSGVSPQSSLFVGSPIARVSKKSRGL